MIVYRTNLHYCVINCLLISDYLLFGLVQNCHITVNKISSQYFSHFDNRSIRRVSTYLNDNTSTFFIFLKIVTSVNSVPLCKRYINLVRYKEEKYRCNLFIIQSHSKTDSPSIFRDKRMNIHNKFLSITDAFYNSVYKSIPKIQLTYVTQRTFVRAGLGAEFRYFSTYSFACHSMSHGQQLVTLG